nr:hypothetical protein [Oscillochloris trichoides]
MNDQWLTLIPLAQTGLTLTVSGTAILLVLMALGAYIGHMRGVRAILTVALGTIAAYLVCVQGGDQIVQVINRIWQNSPKLVAFAAGQDPGAVSVFDPLLTTDLQVPLFFRFIFFIALVAISWFFNKRSKWYGGSPAKHEPLAPILGIFSGALTALLWANAAGLFYDEYVNVMGPLGYPVGTVLASLPDVSQFIPSLILVFILVLVLILVFYMPRILTVPEPPKR